MEKNQTKINQRKKLYDIFKTKDSRWDGRFFVGIKTTGIYCRPVCTAKLAKQSNCEFFDTAAQAEAAGYRPCLRCRPEHAPGYSDIESACNLARQTARIIDETCTDNLTMDQISERIGYTTRHVRRVFEKEYNVSPVSYRQTCRLLIAKDLLTDTDLSVADVAMTSGFGSIRRFNELFRERYGMSPSRFRKNADNDAGGNENKGCKSCVTVGLGYREPFLWDELLDFFRMRQIKGVEKITDSEYSRVLSRRTTGRTTDGREYTGVIKIRNDVEKKVLRLTISDSLAPALSGIMQDVRRVFDLDCEPYSIFEKLKSMNDGGKELAVLGTRIPGCFDFFETAVRAIAGQQITVKAAVTLCGRIAEEFGKPVDTGDDALLYAFPSAEDILKAENVLDRLGRLGVISKRAAAMVKVAELVMNWDICPEQRNPSDAKFNNNSIDNCTYASGKDRTEEIIKALTDIPGIGPWTAKYIVMRAVSESDVFLDTDYGVKKAMPGMTASEIRKVSEDWSPWRSYANVNLWNSLSKSK